MDGRLPRIGHNTCGALLEYSSTVLLFRRLKHPVSVESTRKLSVPKRPVLIEPKVRDCSFRLHTTLPFPTHLGPLDLYLVITP